jgi:cation diffusion facilitator CzcD-associated flavoprotein CzcO
MTDPLLQQQKIIQRAHTSLLIIGAGPFGLAMAAHAQNLGINHTVIGQPMSFWRKHMPANMILRSGCEWHLDPAGQFTLEHFLVSQNLTPSDAIPLTLGLYLEYAEWFQQKKDIKPLPASVTRLDGSGGKLQATLADRTTISADRVLLALGFAPFAYIPEELAVLLPAERSSHTCDSVIPEQFAGQRILIIGGRQSAFEMAALLAEAGAAAVHVCHRHESPEFTPSDWSWVDPLLQRIANEPGWFHNLAASERQALNTRFWSEGRLKLEPWLGPRVQHKAITVHPCKQVIGSDEIGGALHVRLNTGDTVEADHIIYATGYKVDLDLVPLLASGNLHNQIECSNGFPVLDDHLQTSVPGLCITSLPATRDFGLFFAFTAAVRASAQIVGNSPDPGNRHRRSF